MSALQQQQLNSKLHKRAHGLYIKALRAQVKVFLHPGSFGPLILLKFLLLLTFPFEIPTLQTEKARQEDSTSLSRTACERLGG